MSILRELVEINNDTGAIPLIEALEESIRSLSLQSSGGKVNSKIVGAKEFFNSNADLVTAATTLAFRQYKYSQSKTFRLHAKSSYEKKMMTSIADALKDNKEFKLQRIKFENGGKTWVFRKI